MPDDEAALINAIREKNDRDLSPRLVYADWLDEHDRSKQALFIRRQCDDPMQRSTLTVVNGIIKWKAQTCVQDLIYGWDWLGVRFEALKTIRLFVAWFWAGFVEAIMTDAATWIAEGDAIYARNPVRDVKLDSTPSLRMTTVQTRRHRKVTCKIAGRRVSFRLTDPPPINEIETQIEEQDKIIYALEHRWPHTIFETPQLPTMWSRSADPAT